jgi:FAD:protein FMN transferase
MGMPVTVDVRGSGVDPAAIDEVFADLRRMDALFSPFRAGSEASRIDRGELRPEAASPEVRAVIDLCERYRRATGGWFAAGIAGRFDPAGLV